MKDRLISVLPRLVLPLFLVLLVGPLPETPPAGSLAALAFGQEEPRTLPAGRVSEPPVPRLLGPGAEVVPDILPASPGPLLLLPPGTEEAVLKPEHPIGAEPERGKPSSEPGGVRDPGNGTDGTGPICPNGLTARTNLRSAPSVPGAPHRLDLSSLSLQRSRDLELIAREADMHTRRGFELAGRGAHFSARAEFVMALRLLAQGLDAEHQTTTHSLALAAGWTALKEADDFIPSGSRLEADLDLASIIGGHRTPVLKDAPVESQTPLAALQCYFTFAQEQLAVGVGEELAGSIALHGLGNLYRALALKRSTRVAAPSAKAVVFYQAALLVCPQNYMASNELGVLLARGGRYEAARTVLEHSVSAHEQSAGWYNLAVVYQQLGQTDLARQAYRKYVVVYQAETARGEQRLPASRGQIEWVDPSSFARSGAGPALDRPPAPPRPLSTQLGTWQTGTRETEPAAESAVRNLCKGGRAAQIRVAAADGPADILLCQALGPAAPSSPCAVDCSAGDWSCRGGWEGLRAINWQAYAQGEYVGHQRTAHVPEYRLRVDDLLDLVYRVTRDETSTPYRLNVGDEVRVESFTDKELNRDLLIQPDGTITLRLLGQVHATGRTVTQLRDELEKLYTKYYPVPAITVTPLEVNTKLEDLRATILSRYVPGGQSRSAKITPEGTIALPVIGSVQAQGLTLSELQQELNECYREEIEGMEVIPVLVERAPRFVYVLGEVGHPGRFELTGPTTVLQALSMAGSWNVGANLRQIVVFRRGDDWRLMAAMVNLQAALHGNQACPAGEIWLADSDVVIVPKGPILRCDDFIDLVFTRGIYGVLPLQATINFSKLSTL